MRTTAFTLVALLGLAVLPAAAQSGGSEPGWIGVDAGIVLEPGVLPLMIVRQVAPGSPAQLAGLGAGDTLIALDGLVPSFQRFQALRARLRPGDPLEVTVREGGKARTVVVRAARRPRAVPVPVPAQVPVPASASATPWQVGQDRVAGAKLAALNAGLAQYFGTEPRGLLVIEVAPGTPAGDALRPGDVLLRVGGVPVNELAALRRAFAAARPDQTLRLVVIRQRREVEVELPR